MSKYVNCVEPDLKFDYQKKYLVKLIMELFAQIKAIHSKSEVTSKGVLHLIGKIDGPSLEQIAKLWKGRILVDFLKAGDYNHPADRHLKIGRLNGTVEGDLTNTNICYKTAKKLRQDKRKLLKNRGWGDNFKNEQL